MRLQTISGMIGVILLLTGCSMKLGMREITDDARVAQVIIGQTTKDQLLALFGTPDAIETEYDDAGQAPQEVWRYIYLRSEVDGENIAKAFIPFAGPFLVKSQSTRATLLLYWNSDGTVMKIQRKAVRTNGGRL
jgi:outer membrane protein assembly factor BamE (lipoprotein component of BamABCDE complex)